MKRFEHVTIDGRWLQHGQQLGPAAFVQCHFEGAVLVQPPLERPDLRARIVAVQLIGCSETGVALETAILDDVVVDGLKTSDLLQLWSCALRHVVLRGRIGRIMFSPLVDLLDRKPELNALWRRANDEFYSSVDWALDISAGEFQECEIRGIPGRLIRRDPETQVVVTREKVLSGKWRDVDLEGTHWGLSIEFMLRRGDADVVLVAPKRDRKYKKLLEGLRRLRDAGIAEPD